MSFSVETRYGAFATHLLISIALLIILLSIIFFIWFPYELIFAGGIDGLKILMGVDLVLGPVLTLCVYKKGKKGLIFDLTLIGLAQAGCMLAGLWLIYNERPLLQVLADDGVHLVAASSIKRFEVEPGRLPGPYPKQVLVDLPEEPRAANDIKIRSVFEQGIPLYLNQAKYIPMHQAGESRFESRIKFIKSNLIEQTSEQIRALPQHDCEWIPIHSPHVKGFACISYGDGVTRLSHKQLGWGLKLSSG